MEYKFDHPNPFIIEWPVQSDDLDEYGHVNNVKYISKLEELAWAHTTQLGISMEDYKSHDRGMAIIRHEIDYLGSAYLDDVLICATWIIESENKLRLPRAFQMIRQSDAKTVLRAYTTFVCIELSSGRIKRMPAHYAEVYGNVAQKATT